MVARFKRKSRENKLERAISKIPIIGKPIDRGYATFAVEMTTGVAGFFGYIKAAMSAPQYWIPITIVASLAIPLAAAGVGHYIDKRCERRDEENATKNI